MKVNICIVGFLGRHLPKLVYLLSRVAESVYVITIVSDSSPVSFRNFLESINKQKNVKLIKLQYHTSYSIFMRILNHIHMQLRITLHLLMLQRCVNLFLFFIGGEGLILPILTLRLFKNKVALMLGGVALKVSKLRRDPLVKILSLLFTLNLHLVDAVIVYSHDLIREARLDVYRSKIIIAHEHFLDFTKFKIERELDERPNVIGFIGRLSPEKGILNLIYAIPLIVREVRE